MDGRVPSQRPKGMLPATRPGFEEYVTARSGPLLRFAYLLCGDRHLAEDLVQEVLVKAHRRWSALEADNPDSYLKRALVRTHISWLRRRASSEVATAVVPDLPGAGFDDAHASRDEAWGMLARLPRSQRAVLVLRYFEDLDDQRIAELVGVSPSTVRTHALRGLRTLRETLTAQAQEAPTGAGLVEEVRRGVARRAARRRAVAGGLAAVLVAAVISVAALLLPGRGGEPPVQPTPSPTVTSDLVLVPTTLAAPVFPYAVSYLPAGIGPASVHVGSAGASVVFGDSSGEGDCDCYVLELAVAAERRDMADFADQASAVTVNGSPATLWERFALVEWERDGNWLYASTHPEGVSIAELLRVAEGLVPGTTASAETGPLDGAQIMLPAGHAIYSHAGGHVCASAPPHDENHPALCIAAGPPSSMESYGDQITVDGMSALYGRAGSATWLTVVVSGERHVTVRYEGNLDSRPHMALEDLIAIYHGIVFKQ